MNPQLFDMDNIDIAWCPGCGNFSILKALKQALAELGITLRSPEETLRDTIQYIRSRP